MAQISRPLSENEIQACLLDLNFVCSLDNLRNPNRDFMFDVLKSFMTTLQIDADSIINMISNFGVESNLENPELYEGTMGFMAFFNSVRRLLEPAGISDLSINDILDPKPKRTKKILNYLIFLWRHVIMKMKRDEDIMQSVRIEKQQQDEMKRKLDALSHKYHQLLDSKPNSNAVDEIKMKCADNKMKLIQKMEVNNDKSEEYRVLKLNIAEEQVAINDLNVEVINEKEAASEIRSKIVSSPDRLNMEVDQLVEEGTEQDLLLAKIAKDQEEKREASEAIQCKINALQKNVASAKFELESGKGLRKEVASFGTKKQEREEIDRTMQNVEKERLELEENMTNSDQKVLQMDLSKKHELNYRAQVAEMHSKSLQKESQSVEQLITKEQNLKLMKIEFDSKVSKAEALQEAMIESLQLQCSEKQKKLENFYEEKSCMIDEATAILQKACDA